jgi:hypothetical protein
VIDLFCESGNIQICPGTDRLLVFLHEIQIVVLHNIYENKQFDTPKNDLLKSRSDPIRFFCRVWNQSCNITTCETDFPTSVRIWNWPYRQNQPCHWMHNHRHIIFQCSVISGMRGISKTPWSQRTIDSHVFTFRY